jgi:type IV conjugative transfer system protein TraL
MEIKNHVILNHVDSPLKILFWTKGELCLFLMPFLGGVLTDELLMGVGISLLNGWGVNRYKKTFGKGQLQAVIYWFLPAHKTLKVLPQSYIREYMG